MVQQIDMKQISMHRSTEIRDHHSTLDVQSENRISSTVIQKQTWSDLITLNDDAETDLMLVSGSRQLLISYMLS